MKIRSTLLMKLAIQSTTIVIFFTFLSTSLYSQRISATDLKELSHHEDSLKVFADSMINATEASVRFRADSSFTRTLVRALKIHGSFRYPFDSLVTISRLSSPDSTFRIFTWQLKRDEYVYLQKGAIQMNTRDGSLKLFPLFDYSMFTARPYDSLRTPQNWIGAIYYKLVLKEYNGHKFYTLLGFDDFSVSSNKKWMEVLHFEKNGEPVFGGPYISFKDDTLRRAPQSRFMMEYKKETSTTLNYDPELDMIIFDHLISETEEPEKKNTYIPDGTFEGFKWQKGQWVHVDKVFNFSLKDGQFPLDESILDDKGNINEKVLQDASDKNIERANKKKKP